MAAPCARHFGRALAYKTSACRWTTVAASSRGHASHHSLRSSANAQHARLLATDAKLEKVEMDDSSNRWDLYREEEQSELTPSNMWKVRIDHKFTDEDFARFSGERELFRSDPRLQPEALPRPPDVDPELDWVTMFKGLTTAIRLGDYFIEPFRDMLVERLVEQGDLMVHFGIPPLEDQDATKPLHNHAVPKDGEYNRVRIQAYWLALHVWLLHSKQHIVQESEGLFGSALCATLTRRIFEWQWNNVRGWMHEADVPVMSLTGEVQDLQEYVFGFCVALDQAFKDEATYEGKVCSRTALAKADAELLEGQHGLAPQVKHALWANLYSGVLEHDSPELQELTTYVLRQRVLLESLPRGIFFSRRFNWADFPCDSTSLSIAPGQGDDSSDGK
mmetsp:Transcript_7603/g.13075  ORF Transcript_7603/g.13075 Transcript_7603/m.13075 type:complete len:390 (+) Transcript_7603:63-1232(+)